MSTTEELATLLDFQHNGLTPAAIERKVTRLKPEFDKLNATTEKGPLEQWTLWAAKQFGWKQ